MLFSVIDTIGAWARAYAVILLLGILVTLLFTIFRKSSIARVASQALFIPGVVVHEGGHALACLLTGKKIKAIHLGLHEGFVNFDPRTGARTPLASCLVAFAPLLSCGTIAIYLWRYVDASRAGMTLAEYVFDVYLIVAMIYAAVPSGQDCRVALHSFGERPRVTIIEAISVIWPLWLPDLLGIADDVAFFVYLLGVVPTYVALWLIFVYPHKNLDRGRMYDVRSLLPPDPVRDPLADSRLFPPVPTLSPETEAATRVMPKLSRAYALELAGVKLSRRDRKLLEETA